MGLYETFRKQLSPPWLQRPRGTAWNEAMGAVEDAFLQRLLDATRARYPSHAPTPALAYIGEDPRIGQGPTEGDNDYRLRLKSAMASWQWAGTEEGLLEHGLRPLGFTSVRVIANHQWASLGLPVPDGRSDLWARFWLVCGRSPEYQPRSFEQMEALGFRSADTWGSNASFAEAALLRRVIEQWRPAHALCVGAWAVLGDAGALSLDPPPTSPNWREEAVTVNGGQPAAFWRFISTLQAIP